MHLIQAFEILKLSVDFDVQNSTHFTCQFAHYEENYSASENSWMTASVVLERISLSFLALAWGLTN